LKYTEDGRNLSRAAAVLTGSGTFT